MISLRQASVMFKFIKNPEFVKSGARILFREGRTKGIGQVTQVSLAKSMAVIDYVLHLCIIKSLNKISHFAFIMIEYSNCIKNMRSSTELLFSGVSI